ncbi:alpha/beta fold hydrolase [Aureimonas pseudogalii]|uniref:Pimeloyl-ACP methyl ester carboxylesterase n=1 Tax=Aureimonas pseudogalii TaxID=1744844 RepID=A0A7W6H4U4_9HYPH|nr:alpha/beta hydrolase [Aureimonas pseudogalii]MBB3998314.1 pimeloyl-ACP methyl ester carboxylesterase [Aureimonas pseudogalii]
MADFHNGGFRLSYIDEGAREGPAVVLVHGFASSLRVNWVDPGWVAALTAAGYRVAAFDHRGHGESDKPHDPAAYTPEAMASDVAALADHLGLPCAALFGYSMGARVSAFAGLAYRERFPLLVFGGLGLGLVDGVGDWDPIAAALRAPSLDDVSDERGRMFRAFADRTRSDRTALAACIETSRKEPTRAEIATLRQPVLVGVGTRDDIAGSAAGLADLLPNAEAFDVANRDHMLAVGDRTFKSRVVEFLDRHRAMIAR